MGEALSLALAAFAFYAGLYVLGVVVQLVRHRREWIVARWYYAITWPAIFDSWMREREARP